MEHRGELPDMCFIIDCIQIETFFVLKPILITKFLAESSSLSLEKSLGFT